MFGDLALQCAKFNQVLKLLKPSQSFPDISRLVTDDTGKPVQVGAPLKAVYARN
jgi:hypothetical protein